jgi:hypothetical protein
LSQILQLSNMSKYLDQRDTKLELWTYGFLDYYGLSSEKDHTSIYRQNILQVSYATHCHLNWTHLDSLGFIWTHLVSLGLTWTHSDTLTWSHLDSLGLTRTHLDSLDLTSTHLDSLDLTWFHMDSLGLACSMRSHQNPYTVIQNQ